MLASDLVRANVDVIVTEATPSTAAAKRATASIPYSDGYWRRRCGSGSRRKLGASRRERDGHEHSDQPTRWQETGAIA
jgi:hypothetical protein